MEQPTSQATQSYWPLYTICIVITVAILGLMFWPKSETPTSTPNPILDQASELDTLGWKSFGGQTFAISYPASIDPITIGNSVEFINEQFSLSISEYKTQTGESLENYAAKFMNQEISMGQEMINPLLPTTFRGISSLTFTSKDKITEVEKKYMFFATPKGIYIKSTQTIYKNDQASQKTIDQMLNSLKIKG